MPSFLHDLLHLVTNLGDSGFLTVLSFLTALYLYLVKSHRAAMALTGALLSCLTIMGLEKILIRGCSSFLPSIDIVSPSGHAAMAAAIMGTFAAIFASHFDGWRKHLAVVAAVFLILSIAASRVLLHAHTLNEVLMGLATGLVIATAAALYLRRAPKVPFQARYVALMALIALLLLYGSHTPAEDLIVQLAALLKKSFPICQ